MLRSWPAGQIGPMDEDDLVQKVVEHLLRTDGDALGGTFNGTEQQRVRYLRYTTRYRVIEEERKWLRRRDLQSALLSNAAEHTDATPESWFAYSQLNNVLSDAVTTRFGEEGLTIFRLAWIDGKSNHEISLIRHITANQVAGKKLQIRNLVREILISLDIAAPPRGPQGRRARKGGRPS